MLAALTRGAALHAQETSWRLRVQQDPSAQGCAEEGALASAVTLRMGRAAFVSGASRVVVLEQRRAGRSWRATLRALDAQGAELSSRSIDAEGDDCRALDNALVLSLALLLTPAEGAEPPAEPATARAQSTTSVATLPSLPGPRPSPRPSTFQGAAWLGGGLLVGLLGTAWVGTVLGAELRRGVVLQVEARWSPAVDVTSALRVGAWSASLSAGYEWQVHRLLGVALLGGLQAGSLYASGTAPGTTPARADNAWLSAGVRPRLRVGSEGFFGQLSAGGEALLARPAFSMADAGGAPSVAFSPAPIAFYGELALGARWR